MKRSFTVTRQCLEGLKLTFPSILLDRRLLVYCHCLQGLRFITIFGVNTFFFLYTTSGQTVDKQTGGGNLKSTGDSSGEEGVNPLIFVPLE